MLDIFVDLDDVLEDLCGSWVKALNDKHGLQASVYDIKDWNMCRNFPMLSAEEIFEPLGKPSFWKTVAPKEGAIETMKYLNERHDVYITTASMISEALYSKISSTVYRYFPFIDYKQIILIHKKQLLFGDVMVDDNPKNLIGSMCYGVLFDAPHNAKFDESEHDIRRAHDWTDVRYIIELIESETGRMWT